MDKTKELPIVVVMDGGLVQSIVSCDKRLTGREVMVLDYEADGADDAVADTALLFCCPRRERIRKISRRRYGRVKELVKEREAK